jgi:hypothetical protein
MNEPDREEVSGPVAPASEPASVVPDAVVVADPLAHRRAEPRLLAFLWTVFLLSATFATLGMVAATGAMNLESNRAAGRALFTMVAVGIAVIWPLIRLSQESPARSPRAEALKDVFAIHAPLQAVVWPQVWLAGWRVDVLAVVWLNLLAWTLVVAGVFAFLWGRWLSRGRDGSGWERSASMGVLIAGAMVGGVVATGRSVPRGQESDADLWMLMSPLAAPSEVLAERFWTGTSAVVLPEHVGGLMWMGTLALVVWAGVLWPRRRVGAHTL